MGELVLRRFRDLQQFLPRLGRRVAARMALEELRPQPRLERIDMTDHRRMMDAQNLRRSADRADPRDLICGPDLIPIFHVKSLWTQISRFNGL